MEKKINMLSVGPPIRLDGGSQKPVAFVSWGHLCVGTDLPQLACTLSLLVWLSKALQRLTYPLWLLLPTRDP